MLFIVNKPTNLLFTPANRIVITTHKQLILTQLDFIEEFLSAALTHTHPIHLAHSHHTSQTLVATGSSLQLYWSDWNSKIELRMVVVLNNQMVHSIEFDSMWVAYGNFKQYSSKKIKLYRLDNVDHDHLTCYVGSKQFIVSSTKLIMYEHKTHKRKYIQWQDAKHHTNHIYQHRVSLQAWKVYEGSYIIQAGGTMIYFNDREVLGCIENEGNLVVSGRIAAWFNFGKMRIYEINQGQICDLGEIHSYDGHYYGSILQNRKLKMFFYDFKELMVKTVNPISQPPHSQSTKQKQEKSEIKNQIISPMPQIRQSNGSQQSLANLIEQMTELKRQPFNSSISKHNISRISIQKALKDSISKFQSQLNRSLSQQQKFNDANSNELNELSSNYHQTLKNLKESKELKQSKELQESKEEPILVRCNTLQQKLIEQEQLSRNTISRQANSKFEQINAQIVDIHQHSSNAHLQSYVETPAFNVEQTNNNDPWGALANAWPMNFASNSRIEAIQEIKEEPDLQHRQSKRQSELVHYYDKFNQSKQIGDVIEEEPESSQVIRSPSLSRQSSEKLQIPELKLNSNFIESHLKAYDTLLTEPVIQKNLFDNFLAAQKPLSVRKILNSGIFTQTALEEISTEQKQIQIQKPAAENKAKKRPVGVPMLSIPSFRNMDFSNLPSSPLLNNAPSPILNRYSFAPIIPSQNISINNESKSKLQFWLSDQKQKRKKATQILRQIYRKQPELFEQALQHLVAKVITEPQASLFFTEYVRILNPNSTKDRLLKLYRHIDDSQQHRNLLVNALKQFKLEQVPTICLNFNKNLVGIFRVIYPEAYIEDILAANIKLYEAFLESYFSKKFDRTSIKIQDEIIELAYPRNILNVLLFLNEFLRLPIEQVFEAYTKKMMKYGQIDIINKIINSHIPSVCRIDLSIFTKAAQSITKEILIQNHTASPHLESIIAMMDLKNQHIFKLTIELIEEFNLCEIVFDIHALLELPHSNSSFNVLKELIKANSAYSLGKLHLPQILKKLIWLQKGKKEYYYSEQGVQITKILVVKLLNKQLYSQALNNLIPVAVGLKRSYLAAILLNYFQGRFANRLANVKINGPFDFTKIFKDLINDPQAKGDKIPSNINGRGMKWQEFRSLCKEVLKLDIWQLCYIIYTDHELAYQLTEQSIIKQSQLSQLYKALGNQSSKYKYMKFLNQKQQFLQIPLGSETSQEGHSEELRLTVPHEREYKKKRKFDLSFKEINSLDSIQFSKQKLCRSLLQNDNQTDPVLFDLKFTVSSEQIAQVLRQHYQKSSIQQFLQALKVVDKQQLGIIIQNVQIFKSVYNLHIDIDLKELIPFEYFFNLQEAWVIAQPYIKKQVTTDNFWMYFLAVDIIYSKNQQLIEFLIDKLILEGNDEWAAAVEQILKQIEVRKQFLEDKINQAQQNQMYELKRVLDLNFVKVQSNR